VLLGEDRYVNKYLVNINLESAEVASTKEENASK